MPAGLQAFCELYSADTGLMMPHDHIKALFHWRDYAGKLDGSHPSATIKTMLWVCERWISASHDLETDAGRRVLSIKAELEEWIAQHAEA